MKIKVDFVTNSSSANFLVCFQERIFKKDFPFKFRNYESFRGFKTKKALISYCQDFTCDWITNVTGPKDFYNMSEERYNIMLELIQNGEYVVYVTLENNDWDRVEKFQDLVAVNGGTIINWEKG